MHVKNAVWVPIADPGFDGATVWENRWAPLRSGQADVEAYFTALVKHGYDGWVTLEDFSTELPLTERTADNLAYVRAVHARVTAAVDA